MNIRENLEQLEMEYLSPYAAHSKNSRGRLREESSVISVRYISATGIEYCIPSLFGD